MSIKSSIKTVLTLGRGLAGGIPEAAADTDPIELFKAWFDAARDSGILLPEAFTLATAAADGTPSARMVLLKDVDERGFLFFTNYGSRKARELTENPRAALCFHWAVLQRQVRVNGTVMLAGKEESDAYFMSRGRGSRIGAWASRQSERLSIREDLEQRVREMEMRFADGDVPRPDFWGGYRIEPHVIEFWQGRADRLHDRLVFQRTEEGWNTERLYP